MVARTPTTAPIIRPEDAEFPGWEAIAYELTNEIDRLRSEIDRLQGGGGKEPIVSKADWTHPLYGLWVEMGLDDISKLVAAWFAVTGHQCPKCEGIIRPGPYAPFETCEDCQLCFVAQDRHFTLDTLERAIDRGPDA